MEGENRKTRLSALYKSIVSNDKHTEKCYYMYVHVLLTYFSRQASQVIWTSSQVVGYTSLKHKSLGQHAYPIECKHPKQMATIKY